MSKIAYVDFENGDISHLRGLCDRLMEFQAEHAKIQPELMASMNFENRFVPDYNQLLQKYVVVAYDNETPVGFAFAAVSEITEENLSEKPAWEHGMGGLGFFPGNYKVPTTIGIYKLLFVEQDYRGLNIGIELSGMIMEWLRSHEDVRDLWVYVANGNEKVAKFYEKFGFTHSHSVWNGFIEAYTQELLR